MIGCLIDENKALMAICTHKFISNISVGGIVWGVVNTAFGVVAMQVTMLSVGLVILRVMMLGTVELNCWTRRYSSFNGI